VPVDTMKIHKHTIRIHRYNKNTQITVLNRSTIMYTLIKIECKGYEYPVRQKGIDKQIWLFAD
jgi:hypothetical protein